MEGIILGFIDGWGDGIKLGCLEVCRLG